MGKGGKRMTLRRLVLWLLLAGPAVLMSYHAANGQTLVMDLLHPTGELSIRLMVLAMMIGPLIEIFGANRIFRGWFSIRRNLVCCCVWICRTTPDFLHHRRRRLVGHCR